MQIQWDKTTLLSTLSAFDWSLSQPLTHPAWQAYLDFYQLPNQRHYAGNLNIAQQHICVQAWQPAREPVGTALIVHGLYDHVGLFNHLIAACLARGLRVFCFDLPGHGLSSGEPAAIHSFQDYDQVFSKLLTSICLHYDQPLHLFGQSMGGAICLNYLLKYQVEPSTTPFTSVHLFAPLVRPQGYLKAKLLYPCLRPFLKHIPRGVSRNSHDQDFLHFVQNQDPLSAKFLPLSWINAMLQWVTMISTQPISQLPIQIIQGDDDATVAWRYNLKFLASKFPRSNIHIIPAARHHLVKESLPYREAIWAVIDDNLPS